MTMPKSRTKPWIKSSCLTEVLVAPMKAFAR